MAVQKVGSYFKIRAYGKIDLTAVSNLAVAYEDPNGVTGSLSATVDPTDSRYALADFPYSLGNPDKWKFEITGKNGSGKPIISYETGCVKLKARFD